MPPFGPAFLLELVRRLLCLWPPPLDRIVGAVTDAHELAEGGDVG